MKIQRAAAIGAAVEAELGKRERRGRPEKNRNDRSTFPKGRTRDLAAQRAGFKSGMQYERVQTVVEHGSVELVDAWTTEVSIWGAAAISSQPKEEQNKIINMPKEQQTEVIKRIRKTKADQEQDQRHARDL